jgi:AcrR family transcriptional regulator
MQNHKEDRRKGRTRQLLREALFALMVEKRYDRITIQDIIDRANVGRSTFYAHFQDKEDLVTASLEWVLEQLAENAAHVAPTRHQLIPTLELFQHVQEQQQLFKAVAKGRGFEVFVEKGQAYWSKQIQIQLATMVPKGKKPAVSLALVSTYVANTLATLLKWWLDNKMPYPPERMEEIFQQLVTPGVEAVLGR